MATASVETLLPLIYPPVLTVEDRPNVWLRLSDPADVMDMRELMAENIEHLSEYQHFTPDGTATAIINGMRVGRTVSYAVVADSVTVGSTTLHRIDWKNRTASLGYWISEEHEGNGYMYDAVKCLVDHSFEKAGLDRIVCEIEPANERSIRLAERLGGRLASNVAMLALLNGRELRYKPWEISRSE